MSVLFRCYVLFVFLLFSVVLTGCGRKDPTPDAGQEPSAVSTPEDLDEMDSDGDGLSDADEMKLGTDLTYADTDGDGFSDYDEVLKYNFDPQTNPYRFNPLIADVPQLELDVVSAPRIFITHSDSSGNTTTFETGSSRENSVRTSTSNSIGESKRRENSGTVSMQTKIGVGGSASWTGSYTRTHSKETTVNVTTDVANEHRNTLSRSEAYSANNEITRSGGEVEMALHIANTGHLAFTIQTLGLNLSKVLQSGEEIFIGRMVPRNGGGSFFSHGTLRPGEVIRGELCDVKDLNLSKAESLLQPGAFQIRSSQFELIDENGQPFDLRFTDIESRTALVSIDYGPAHPVENYYVAVSGDVQNRNTVQEVLEKRLRLPFKTGTVLWQFPDGVRASYPGLTGVREFTADPNTRSFWNLSVVRDIGNGRKEEVEYNLLRAPVDLSKLTLSPQHELHLTYVTDPDGDGLGTRTEFLLGTDVNMADTDQDGMPDGEEVEAGRDPLVDDSIPLPRVEEANLTHLGRTVELSGVLQGADSSKGYDALVLWGDGSSERIRPRDQAFRLAHEYPSYGSYTIHVLPVGPGSRRGQAVRVPVMLKERWKAVWARPIENRSERSEGSSIYISALTTTDNGSVYAAVAYRVSRFDGKGEFRWISKTLQRYFQVAEILPAEGGKDGVWVSTNVTQSVDPYSYLARLDTRGEKIQEESGIRYWVKTMVQGEDGFLYRLLSHQGGGTFLEKRSRDGKVARKYHLERKGAFTASMGGLGVFADGSFVTSKWVRKTKKRTLERYAADGNQTWTKDISSDGEEHVTKILVNPQQQIFVIGATTGTMGETEHAGRRDVFVRKYTPEGEELWTTQLGTSDEDLARDAALDSEGNVHLAGQSRGILGKGTLPNVELRDFTAFHLVLNPAGDVIHLRHFHAKRSFAPTLAVDQQDNVYIGLGIVDSKESMISDVQGDKLNVILKLEKQR